MATCKVVTLGPPVDTQTDTTEPITFPQTTCAGDKNTLHHFFLISVFSDARLSRVPVFNWYQPLVAMGNVVHHSSKDTKQNMADMVSLVTCHGNGDEVNKQRFLLAHNLQPSQGQITRESHGVEPHGSAMSRRSQELKSSSLNGDSCQRRGCSNLPQEMTSGSELSDQSLEEVVPLSTTARSSLLRDYLANINSSPNVSSPSPDETRTSGNPTVKRNGKSSPNGRATQSSATGPSTTDDRDIANSTPLLPKETNSPGRNVAYRRSKSADSGLTNKDVKEKSSKDLDDRPTCLDAIHSIIDGCFYDDIDDNDDNSKNINKRKLI